MSRRPTNPNLARPGEWVQPANSAEHRIRLECGIEIRLTQQSGYWFFGLRVDGYEVGHGTAADARIASLHAVSRLIKAYPAFVPNSEAAVNQLTAAIIDTEQEKK